MNDKTKFLATPGRVTSTMRAIMVSNNFSEARLELHFLQLSYALDGVILGKACRAAGSNGLDIGEPAVQPRFQFSSVLPKSTNLAYNFDK